MSESLAFYAADTLDAEISPGRQASHPDPAARCVSTSAQTKCGEAHGAEMSARNLIVIRSYWFFRRQSRSLNTGTH